MTRRRAAAAVLAESLGGSPAVYADAVAALDTAGLLAYPGPCDPEIPALLNRLVQLSEVAAVSRFVSDLGRAVDLGPVASEVADAAKAFTTERLGRQWRNPVDTAHKLGGPAPVLPGQTTIFDDERAEVGAP